LDRKQGNFLVPLPKNPEAGFGVAFFFIWQWGRRAFLCQNQKIGKNYVFLLARDGAGRAGQGNPAPVLRHCFPDANPNKRKRPFLLHLSALDQPERGGKGGAEEGNSEG
jgi:hypothetical protein